MNPQAFNAPDRRGRRAWLADALLSGDPPRSRVLAMLLGLVLAGLVLGPFLFNDPRAFATLGTLSLFIIVVASYDLMLGYTHIVSFAHTLFFGLGAYGVAIATQWLGGNTRAVVIGALAAMAGAALLSLLLGLLSLRVRALFFALVTLAVAFAFLNLVTQGHALTGGEDGLPVRLPHALGPAFRPLDGPLPGFDLPTFLATVPADPFGALQAAGFAWRPSGRHLVYYLCVTASLLVFLFLLRVVNSPFGQVLRAIRENEFRAQALGYRTVLYRIAAVVLGSTLASLAGVLFALFQRYVNPANTLDFGLMTYILIMCVLGGMGTLYGAIVGTAIFTLAQNYLQDLLRAIVRVLPPDGPLTAILAPEHWLLWFGLLFVASVYCFPDGIVGRLRARAAAPPR